MHVHAYTSAEYITRGTSYLGSVSSRFESRQQAMTNFPAKKSIVYVDAFEFHKHVHLRPRVSKTNQPTNQPTCQSTNMRRQQEKIYLGKVLINIVASVGIDSRARRREIPLLQQCTPLWLCCQPPAVSTDPSHWIRLRPCTQFPPNRARPR